MNTSTAIMHSQGLLFLDFNGVISYDTFWSSLQHQQHPLHRYYEPIEEILFRGESVLVDEWMLGNYTSEQIHQMLAAHLGVPYQELFEVFCEDCKRLDISTQILEHVQTLRNSWYCILRTDNMDSFHRFTLPANPCLAAAFDEVHSSYLLRQLKKSNEGEYFLTMATRFGMDMGNCVLIEDSKTTCDLFEKLGGKAYRTNSEREVLEVLDVLGATRR